MVATQTYPSDDTTDYNVQVNACKDAGAELVFLPISVKRAERASQRAALSISAMPSSLQQAS